MSSSSRRILCLWFPRWPLERLLAAQPELRDERLLLYEQTPQASLRIVAATDAVLRPGMPLAEGLARGPASLHCHDPWADRQALVALADHCRRHSPTVGLEEGPHPDCLFLDLTGLPGECSAWSAAWGVKPQLPKGMRQGPLAHFTLRAAVAETVGAAWGLAHYGLPDAECAAPGEHSGSALHALPLAALRLPDTTRALLARLGLHRVGQVEALPRTALATRFGPPLLDRLDQMFGRLPETLLVPRGTVEFAAEHAFETPIENREAIEAVCRSLVYQVAAPLAARQEGVLQGECRFDCSLGRPLHASVGLFRPSASAEHLWQLLRLRLESLRLASAVTGVRWEVQARAPLAWQQQELFPTDRGQSVARQAALLIDRLSNRLGRQAVVRGIPLSDAQPEHACLRVPLAGSVLNGETNARPAGRRAGQRGKRSTARTAELPAGPLPRERPLWLRRQPVPLHEVRPDARGAPCAFRLAGRDHRVTHAWGPERIETGWWRTGLVRRDYYRVETTTGSRYWLFHDLRHSRWFLHGEFA